MPSLITMCSFSLAMSISPGPVNLVTLTTGFNYGFSKTFPFVSGATTGFTLLLLTIGLGLGQLVTMSPFLTLLQYGGTGFIIYLGYKIAMSGQAPDTPATCKPVTFRDGLLMQWLNPKAWMACIAGVGAFNLAGNTQALLFFTLIYFTVCYISIACWGLLGARAGRFLNTPRLLRAFNILMGSSLILVALYLHLMPALPEID